MLNREEVLEAIKDVQDPEIRKSLVELGMIRDVQIEGTNVSLEVVLTVPGCPLKAKMQDDIEAALKPLGVTHVDIRFGAMNEEERARLSAQLQAERQGGGQAPQAGANTAEGPLSPLLAPGSKTKFIAVASGKGGVGKSTVTVNLATALARAGKKVGIIDADIYGFSVPDMMGISQRPVVIDQTILPVERHGVQVMSMGFFIADNSPVVWRGPLLGKMIRSFFSDVHWDDLDYMLLDLPPGTGDVALDVHQIIPHSSEIIVTTPHATAAYVAVRAGVMARKTKHDILGVVENMSYLECGHCGEKQYVFGRGGGATLARELGVDLLASIPLGLPDFNVVDPEDSPSIYKADSPTGKLYLELAEKVIHKLEK
ncbi:Mrp/NBP35 family ATP-binding protein [Rubeoparvulum massiliense]|uniref:Mrp/NBP35 family ATP-binding protein n=1 Tax=Rubeoparvulum massiliense TaxID=1631346 RepID=UPI00065E7871|nr:Mrp/NBP35 family ATP-binding protein [Rubeoparvulum massiliense]